MKSLSLPGIPEDVVLVLLVELLQLSELGRFIWRLCKRIRKSLFSLVTRSLLFHQRQEHGFASSTFGQCFYMSNELKEEKPLDYMDKYSVLLFLSLLKMIACSMAASTGFA